MLKGYLHYKDSDKSELVFFEDKMLDNIAKNDWVEFGKDIGFTKTIFLPASGVAYIDGIELIPV